MVWFFYPGYVPSGAEIRVTSRVGTSCVGRVGSRRDGNVAVEAVEKTRITREEPFEEITAYDEAGEEEDGDETAEDVEDVAAEDGGSSRCWGWLGLCYSCGRSGVWCCGWVEEE